MASTLPEGTRAFVADTEPLTAEGALARLQSGEACRALIIADVDLFGRRVEPLIEALGSNDTLQALQITASALPHSGLGDEGCTKLSQALVNNPAIHTLGLDHCRIGVEGAQALARLVGANTSLTHINFDANNLQAEGTDMLCGALRNNAVETLEIAGNEIGDEGVAHLAELLKGNATVRCLGLSANDITDNGMRTLAMSLRQNTCLESLDVSHNHLGEEGARSIAEIMEHNHTLTELNCSHNNFSGNSDAVFVAAFTESKSVQTLNLAHCQIDDDGAFAFAEMLAKNSSLTSVDLRENQISELALNAMAAVMKTNTTLCTLAILDDNDDNPVQLLLTRFCRRNLELRGTITKPLRITERHMAARLPWDQRLVQDWLRKIHIPQAMDVFQRLEVDGRKLVTLSMDDLRRMDIRPREKRLELFDAIELLRDQLIATIREERGDQKAYDQEQESARLLATLASLEVPRDLPHDQMLKSQYALNCRRSPLRRIRTELQTFEDEVMADAAALSAPAAAATSSPRRTPRKALPSTPMPPLADNPGPISQPVPRSPRLAAAAENSPRRTEKTFALSPRKAVQPPRASNLVDLIKAQNTQGLLVVQPRV